MNTFANAITNMKTETENGMPAFVGTGDKCLDLFYKIGASRGMNIIPHFVAAFQESPDIAIRILLWSRDVREGAGERDIFRNVLKFMIANPSYQKHVLDILTKIKDLGRFDDLLVVFEPGVTTGQNNLDEILHEFVSLLIQIELTAGNALMAKWMPRQGPVAAKLRSLLGVTPKEWRQLLVRLTNVVETKMCAQDWTSINYGHVPSQASRIYRKSFQKHDPEGFEKYTQSLVKGEAKINAGAVYPYQIIHDLVKKGPSAVTITQWDALPNYVGEASILPMVDTSGSMADVSLNKSSVTALDVAVSLGLYLADKNKGNFKDVFLTFSSEPVLMQLKGNVKDKMDQMNKAAWAMNTDLEKAMKLVLKTAIDGKVPQSEMPQTILILSDMQFDYCVQNSQDSAMVMIERKFRDAGYQMPNVVFWNLNDKSNVPAKSTAKNVALVSGFSPAIMKSVLAMESFDPISIMLKTVMDSRYDYQGSVK